MVRQFFIGQIWTTGRADADVVDVQSNGAQARLKLNGRVQDWVNIDQIQPYGGGGWTLKPNDGK